MLRCVVLECRSGREELETLEVSGAHRAGVELKHVGTENEKRLDLLLRNTVEDLRGRLRPADTLECADGVAAAEQRRVLAVDDTGDLGGELRRRKLPKTE